ncbi:hypothetical protein NDA11_004204 [Ustilago hordei]|uniref:Uncharacterized protein n=1 Tax=Ustilago hordei TaxID=120017 RepID=I2FTD8_USTHO|nr:uncharacterized protein UHO2_05941 [Ustilago hordei]KAJ1043751.1 hypothetical protein NDA10_000150 [Ustilago hordei]KAJ1572417.1 hypothetical protein NDA12_000635 [Ustilago hordei]KAJ1576099.1 hypothetical protein NDA15_001358 [Ustilago hordei]KAJ1593841.1 hypothetical protein NDA11_004204 [Ustilago hordei]KAJ1595489.1 hypothetical protein NDA14_007316 [Ustilago hordei]
MLLSPAVKTSYLNTMAARSSPTPKRRAEAEENLETCPLSGKRARPTIPLRSSRSGSSFQVQQFQQQSQMPSQFTQHPFASSSDVTLDDLSTQQQNQQPSIFTHSSASSDKGKGAENTFSFASSSNDNPHWLKVVTSYGYTFIKSDELHLLQGNADIQMVIEPSNPAHQNQVPASPPAQMRYPMGVEFPPTPSPSDDGTGSSSANRYFAQQHTTGKPLWEHVEGDQEAARAQAQAQMAVGGGDINEMMTDGW